MENLKKLYNRLSVKLILPPFLMFIIVILLALFVGNTFFKKIVHQKAELNISELKTGIDKYLKAEKENLYNFATITASNNEFTAAIKNNNFEHLKNIQDKLRKTKSEFLILNSNKQIIYPHYKQNNNFSFQDKDVFYTSNDGVSYINVRIPLVENGNILGYFILQKPLRFVIKNYPLPSYENIFLVTKNKSSLAIETNINNQGEITTEILNSAIKNNIITKDIYSYKTSCIDEKCNINLVMVYSSINELDTVKTIFRNLSIFSLLILVLGGIFYQKGMDRVVIKRINKLKKVLNRLAKGEITEHIEITAEDEIGEMNIAANKLIENIKNTSEFASNIGAGNLNFDYKPAGENDVLGLSLIKMKEDLIEADKIKKQQEIEEHQRTWAANGRVQFADILRQNDNMKELADNIVSTLVKYLKATQAGVYLINENDPDNKYLELISLYAYDRHKFMQRELELTEGLTGACIYEKETIVLKEIPENYLLVTSGLGEAPPNNLILIPLKLEEEVFGVIELASFKIFKDYEIEFLEGIAENIAASLHTVRVNEKTSALLEQSQQQAEELAAQEEEMRQNIEELQATQEDMARVNSEAKQTLENMRLLKTPIINVNKEQEIIFINKAASIFAKTDEVEAIGKQFCNLFNNSNCNTNCIITQVVESGQSITSKAVFTKTNEELEYYAVPVFNEHDEIKYISIQIITSV